MRGRLFCWQNRESVPGSVPVVLGIDFPEGVFWGSCYLASGDRLSWIFGVGVANGHGLGEAIE